MFLRNTQMIIVLLISMVMFGACSDSGTSVVESGAVIQGSVEGDGSQAKMSDNEVNIENTAVWAGTIRSNGSIEKIEGTETDVNSSGDFTLEVQGNFSGNLAIIAEDGSEQLKGFISAEVESGNSYNLKPINMESTAETMIYTHLFAEGNADIVHKSDIETIIRSESSADIYAGNTSEAEVAAAIKNAADARIDFIAANGNSDVDSQITQYFETMTEIQFDYETAVSNSSSSEARAAAYEALIEAQFNAYTELETELKNVAKLTHMQKHVIQSSLGSASAGVKNETRASSSYLASVAIDAAVRSSAESSGMSGTTISAIADAGSSLKSEVRSSTGAQAEIQAAFDTYHGSVRSAIENDASTDATVIVAIDTELNTAGGAKLLFDSAISGVLGGSSLVDAYINFESNVNTTVQANEALIGSIDTEVLAEMLLLINLF